MRFQAPNYVILLSVAQYFVTVFAATTTSCTTYYGTVSTTSLPTSTKTKTVNVTYTRTTTEYSRTTSYTPTTYYSVVGKKTTEVPLGPYFTPLTSVNTVTSTFIVGKRDDTVEARSGKPPTPNFPTGVICTTTSTSVHTKYVTTSASSTEYAWTAITSTTAVATSTAYAACAPSAKNVLKRFQGKPLAFGDATEAGVDACNDPSIANATRAIACLNARTCCEGAQRYNYSGFFFDVNPRGFHECGWYRGTWSFNNLVDYDQGYYFGNGPAGGGEYEYIVTENCCGG